MMKIHHISTLASQFKPNLNFYTKVLGLRLVKNTVNQENPSMRHVFYGDYLGSPGTVLTFFIVPLLGKRTDGNHYINSVTLQIPTGSFQWWAAWLTKNDIVFHQTNSLLTFDDPDQFTITLTEGPAMLAEKQINSQSPVPADKQIVQILGTSWAGPAIVNSATFFHDFLSTNTDDQKVDLDNNQFIKLVQTNEPTKRTRFGRGSIDHLALQVDSEDELFAYWQKTVQQGWQLEIYRDRHWFKSIYLRDTSNNRLELATTSPGFTIDEQLDDLGTSLVLPPWLENKRAVIEDQLS